LAAGIGIVDLLRALWVLFSSLGRVFSAWKFAITVEDNTNYLAERIRRELGISVSRIDFGLKERLMTMKYYLMGKFSLWYVHLLEKYIVKHIYEHVRGFNIFKDVIFIFLIFRYRDDVSIEHEGRVYDIDVKEVLRILRGIEESDQKLKLLASMAYLSQFHVRIGIKDLLSKAQSISPNKHVIREMINSIRHVIKHKYVTMGSILKILYTVATKEKVLKTLNLIERKLRCVVAKSVDMERLLLFIGAVKREFEVSYRGRYLLILFIRERGYNILHAYPELFIEKLPSRRSRRFRFIPIRELWKSEFYRLEDKLFGLTSDVHELPEINGVARPLAYLTYPPKIIQIGKRRRLIRGRIGLLYFIETKERLKTEKIWESFKKHVLSRKAQAMPLAYVVVEVKEPYSGYTDITESPLKTTRFYSYRRSRRSRKLLGSIYVEHVSAEEAILVRRRLIFELLRKELVEKIVIPEREVLTYSQLLRELLKLSDFITEFPVSDNVKRKLDEIEEVIIKNVQKAFPEYDIRKPLDLWYLYKDPDVHKRAINILANNLSKLFPTIAIKVAEDILLTAYITSILGPYMEYTLFEKLTEAKLKNIK